MCRIELERHRHRDVQVSHGTKGTHHTLMLETLETAEHEVNVPGIVVAWLVIELWHGSVDVSSQTSEARDTSAHGPQTGSTRERKDSHARMYSAIPLLDV